MNYGGILMNTESVMQFKVCLLGGSAVGKSSLIARFVHSIFSAQYHTTVGVRIEKKLIESQHGTANLIVWDINGEDAYQKVQTTYLRGMSGYLLVADGTRPQTLDESLKLHTRVIENFGTLPVILLLNKADLQNEWRVDLQQLAELNISVLNTSALTGEHVESAFQQLAQAMLLKAKS